MSVVVLSLQSIKINITLFCVLVKPILWGKIISGIQFRFVGNFENYKM